MNYKKAPVKGYNSSGTFVPEKLPMDYRTPTRHRINWPNLRTKKRQT